MTELLPLLERIIGILLQSFGLAQLIQGQTVHVAQETVPYEIATELAVVEGLLTDPDIGQKALSNKIAALAASQTAGFAAVEAAIGTPQQAGSEVTLPAVPPAGYGGLDATATGDAVWLWKDSQNNNAITLLQLGGYTGEYDFEWIARSIPGQPYLRFVTAGNDFPADLNNLGPQQPLDAATIVPSDATPAAWVERAYADYGWQEFGLWDNTTVLVYADGNNPGYYWALDLTQQQFDALRSSSTAIAVAPVWPGLAAATLGTPVALAPSVTVPGPLDGIIVSITSVTEQAGFYPFADIRSYRNLGALVFVDDNGQAEYPQNLGLTSGVYTPKSMVQASECILRTYPGVTGTVTPWVVS